MKRFALILIMAILAACAPRRLPRVSDVERLVFVAPVYQGYWWPRYGVEIDISAGGMDDELKLMAPINSKIVRTWVLYDRVPQMSAANVEAFEGAGQEILMAVKGYQCYLDPSEFDAFFTWLEQTIREYPGVDVWEAWNEPEIAGCIPPYFGGWAPVGAEQYTKFLNRFYSVVKATAPDARVMVGSFCLCYTDDDPNWGFVQYVLEHGNYDVVGFHHYSRYPSNLINELGKLDANVKRLRDWSDAPLYLTETSTITLEGCTERIEEYQADWLWKVTEYAKYAHLSALVWYGLTIDWECSAMIGPNGPREAYDAAVEAWR